MVWKSDSFVYYKSACKKLSLLKVPCIKFQVVPRIVRTGLKLGVAKVKLEKTADW